MKKALIIAICLFSVAFLHSCKKYSTIIYIYMNNSGVDVVLKYPKYGFLEEETEIAILDGQSYSWGYDSHYTGDWPFYDSKYIKVVFAGEKEIIQYNEPPFENTVFNYLGNSYEFKTINSHKRRAYYYFTPEMYEQATPIEP